MLKAATGKIKEITSLANPIIKDLRGLAQKKHRERDGLFLTEGLKLVLEGLDLGAKIRILIYAEASEAVEKAAVRAYAAGALIIKTNRKIMEVLCQRDNAQNCIGVFEQQWQEAQALLAGLIVRPQGREIKWDMRHEHSALSRGHLFLALDRIRDPGNLGTIIRTADAVGADGIILVGETTSPYALEAVRATMGSIFALPLARVKEEQFLKYMADFQGMKIGTHLKGAVDYRTIPYFAASNDIIVGEGVLPKKENGFNPAVRQKDHLFKADKAVAEALTPARTGKSQRDVLLLMGNEQQGLTDNLAKACDILARIPQAGRADSLNLAVSTGIMLFEICRNYLHL